MTTPRLEIYLDESGALCIAKKERLDAPSRVILSVELDELKSLNPADGAYRVGGTVLNVLRLWHKEEFEDWEVPGLYGEP